MMSKFLLILNYAELLYNVTINLHHDITISLKNLFNAYYEQSHMHKFLSTDPETNANLVVDKLIVLTKCP